MILPVRATFTSAAAPDRAPAGCGGRDPGRRAAGDRLSHGRWLVSGI